MVARGQQRIADFYSDLETRLQEARFVAGGRFSAADITAVVTVDFATKALELPLPAGNSASRRWYEVIAGRPSFAA